MAGAMETTDTINHSTTVSLHTPPLDMLPCCPRLPFLRRNLGYIRNQAYSEQEGAQSNRKRKKNSNQQRTTTIKKGTATSKSSSSSSQQPILYQLHTKTKAISSSTLHRNSAKVSTLFRKNATCPLCSFKALDLESLWMHWTTSNIHYSFTVLQDKDGVHHMAANPDRVLTPRLKRVEGAPNLAFQNEVIYCKQGNIFCQKISTKGVVFKAYEPEPSLKRALSEKVIGAPVRDYYHPMGFSKITIGEWMLLDTIVSPSDDAWQLRIANSMLDDFNDVAEDEKRFVKLWNAFVRSSPIHIPNKEFRQQCMKFIGMHASVIHLYEEHFICHLITLWEEHQLSRDDILIIMKHYGEVVAATQDRHQQLLANRPANHHETNSNAMKVPYAQIIGEDVL